MTRYLRTIPILCTLVPSLAYAQMNRAKVVTDEFSTIQGEIITLDQDGLQLLNQQGISTQMQWDTVFGMSVMAPTNIKHLTDQVLEENTLVFVDTTDGQRVFMTLLDSDNPDFILGSMGPTRLRINLEHVRSVWRIKQSESRTPLTRTETDPDTDRIRLTNGDDLTGFILSIGSTTSIETDAGIVEVPLSRTRSIQLANPSTPREYLGQYIHTDLGLVYRSDRFTLDPKTGELSMALTPGVIAYEPNREPVLDNTDYNWPGFDLKLAAVEIRHDDRWVSNPLEGGEITYEPTGERSWTPEPSTYNLTINTLDAGSIRFDAPTRLSTDIHPGAVRLRCKVRPAQLPWTNCIASIQAIDSDQRRTTIWTQHITGRDDPIAVDVPIPSGSQQLSFVIDPGDNGPIQDGAHFAMIRVLVME